MPDGSDAMPRLDEPAGTGGALHAPCAVIHAVRAGDGGDRGVGGSKEVAPSADVWGMASAARTSDRQDLNAGTIASVASRPATASVPITTNKYPGMVAIVDAADLPIVAGKRFNFSPGKPGKQMQGSVVVAGVMTPLARLILNLTDPDLLVSHANGNRLDCRRENLLVRSRSAVALARKPSAETVERLKPYPDPDRAGVWRVPLRSYLTQREALIDEGRSAGRAGEELELVDADRRGGWRGRWCWRRPASRSCWRE